MRHHALQPVGGFARAGNRQLDPVRPCRHDLDRRLGSSLQGVSNKRHERQRLDRLVHELMRPLSDRLQDGSGGIVGREDHDPRLSLRALDSVEHPEAVQPGHPDVEEHQIVPFCAQAVDRFGAILRDANVEPRLREHRPHDVPRSPIIVDDEHAGGPRDACRHVNPLFA